METERIALSQRERDRLRVLQDVEQGHLTQVEAAGRIHLCDRQVRRLLLRLREQGDRAMLHGLRGRPSNRKFAVTFEQKVWHGYGNAMRISDPRSPPSTWPRKGYP